MPPPGYRLPTYSELAQKLVQASVEKSEWAGLPIPIPEMSLVLEPKYPYRFHIDTDKTIDESAPDYEVVNSWHSDKLGTRIVIFRKNGKLGFGIDPLNRVNMWINTLIASKVWPLQAETKALEKLQALIKPHMFEAYLMTGMFLESSPRSKVFYLFRKSRPTIAFKESCTDGKLRVLAGLCGHIVGYYQDSWAGVMTPTDEVIGHLVMMRGDEKLLWRRCNQHPAHHHACAL